MFAPQYNIEINNDGQNGQIGPEVMQAVYNLGKGLQKILCNNSPVMAGS